MAFNKKDEYKAIDDMLNEVRIACNRALIPFIWVAAVKDDEDSTVYMVAVDENQEVAPEVVQYKSNALTPGSLEVKLQDDKIRDVIKVLNGFKTTSENPIAYNPEDFSISSILPEQSTAFEFDKSEGIYLLPSDDDEPEIHEKEEADIPVLSLKSQRTLPKIDED